MFMLALLVLIMLVAPMAMAADNELIVGGGLWWNRLAEGNYFYGEDVVWTGAGSNFGVGLYGMRESGESKTSDYTWSGYLLGPQIGFQNNWTGSDGLPEQWQLKLRLVYEETKGESATSGYHFTQKDVKAGLYGEYVNQVSLNWKTILSGEGWFMLQKERDSSWDEDEAEDRNQACAGFYGQWNPNKDFSIRFGAGPFYQGWDDMTGVTGRVEIRLAETVMVGGYVSYPLNLPSEYKELGANKNDLTTVGAFIRIEF